MNGWFAFQVIVEKIVTLPPQIIEKEVTQTTSYEGGGGGEWDYSAGGGGDWDGSYEETW